MATIKAIEDRTIHQIQSGQVIVDICSVVKELVENSLDAGATSIDVRFRNQGLDAIEVQDNGAGISSDNYATIALKHYTSKLATYADLAELTTFGFRGEALSSLCALSKFTITTCTAADLPKGTKLEFEVTGAIKNSSMVAAQKGTTVVVEELFYHLPVRRRELERNIKKEWTKVIAQLMQSACVQTGVKFSVTSQVGKKRTTMFSTRGNQTTRDNIINVFGTKTMNALVDMDLKLELTSTSTPSQRWGTQEDGGTKDIRVVGYISRPAHGEGRQTPDRQMFYVNARPCGLPQVAKAFNEVYKSYNNNQSPFIFANIIMHTNMYDVNVSPDKRTIFLHDQAIMLEELKEKLGALFEMQNYMVPVSQLPLQKPTSYIQKTTSRHNSTASTTSQRHIPSQSKVPEKHSEESETDEASSIHDEQEVDVRTDIRGEKEVITPLQRRNPLISNSMSQDREADNLLSKWLKLDAKNTDEDVTIRNLQADGDEFETNTRTNSTSMSKEKLVDKLKHEAIKKVSWSAAKVNLKDDDTGDTLARSNSLVSVTQPRLELPVSVRDFDAQLADLSTQREVVAHAELPSPSRIHHATSTSQDIINHVEQKITPAVTPFAIGKRSISASFGVPSAKRTWPVSQVAKSGKVPVLPSFGNKLSQRFLAGTSNGRQSDERDEDRSNLFVIPGSDVLESMNMDTSGDTLFPTSSDLECCDHDHGINTQEANDGPNECHISASQVDVDDDIDEDKRKAEEDAKVQEIIRIAEESNAFKDSTKRTQSFMKGGAKRKDNTVNLEHAIETSLNSIAAQLLCIQQIIDKSEDIIANKDEENTALDSDEAEEKLSLIINKTDFAQMKIIGQFNLGFILASRSVQQQESCVTNPTYAEDIFIIDQHASDEKYNFERLQNTTVVQSQPLVRPKRLDLTAVEEEIVQENLETLAANGFNISIDDSGDAQVGCRCNLLSLPLSKQTIFTLQDLEELIFLLSEDSSSGNRSSSNARETIVRPSKVRKMFAMRACRSSIMIGKTLGVGQMRKVVDHLGDLDKPWNCPHGRPTMRHLCGLARWNEDRGSEVEDIDCEEGKRDRIDWNEWIKGKLAT